MTSPRPWRVSVPKQRPAGHGSRDVRVLDANEETVSFLSTEEDAVLIVSRVNEPADLRERVAAYIARQYPDHTNHEAVADEILAIIRGEGRHA